MMRTKTRKRKSKHKKEPKSACRLTHANAWRAIDRIAVMHGLTASGLARKAGLDPTSFNTSKRVSPTGKDRWLSTETIAKVLRAVGKPTFLFFDALRDDWQ